ncbi:hypothetical protein [Thermogutta sp.]|uniref:type II secretion system F family protein n=1 Tax=Thermogutta sp. TaxID=1962930 RepID=UPI00321FB419
MNLPEIPVWLVAGIGGIWAALILWQLVGRRTIEFSRDRARLARITSTGEEVQKAPRIGLEQELEQAGVNLSSATFSLIRIGGSVAAFLVALAFNLPPLLGIGGAVAVWWGSRSWLKSKAENRGRKMEEELPAALARIAALVDVERDLPSLLVAVAESLTATNPASPLAAELYRTASDLRSRGPAALVDLEKRAPSPSVAMMAFNLRVFLESGGEAKLMAESAERMQRLIEGRNAARAKAASALMLAKMFPILMVGVSIFTFQDPSIGAFYRSIPGQFLLMLIAGMMLLGYRTIQKMVENVA